MMDCDQRTRRTRCGQVGVRGVVVLLALLGVAGCASTQVGLPPVTPSQLPDAWIDVLVNEPAPRPFRARLRMRLKLPGKPGVRLDGTLLGGLPEHLRLSGKLGVFRPIFNLYAVEDSCEMLIHEESSYWITPRVEPNWVTMNPSAWVQVLEWAFSSGSFFADFRAIEPGRVEGDLWTVYGTVAGTPFTAEMGVSRRDRTLQSILLREGEDLVVSVHLRDHQRWGEASATSVTSAETGLAQLPKLLEFELPHEGETLELTVEVTSLSPLSRTEFEDKKLVLPPGWTRIGGNDRHSIPIPEMQ